MPSQTTMDEEVDTSLAIAHGKSESPLHAMISATIESSLLAARAAPRNVAQAISAIRAMATSDARTAEACRYRKPIDDRGGFAEGGSIRLAEIVASCWGNLAIDPPVIHAGTHQVEAHVVCRDLQTNMSSPGTCAKSIVYGKRSSRAGQRYTPDMISLTCQVATAIARRNAILSVVPRVFWEPILDECRAVVAGSIKDLGQTIARTLQALQAKGISEDRVLAALGRSSRSELTAEDMADLRGIGEAVKSGELTLDEAFPRLAPSPETTTTRTDAVVRSVSPPPNKEPAVPSTPQPQPQSQQSPVDRAQALFLRLSPANRQRMREQFQFSSSAEFSTWGQNAVNDIIIALQNALAEENL